MPKTGQAANFDSTQNGEYNSFVGANPINCNAADLAGARMGPPNFPRRGKEKGEAMKKSNESVIRKAFLNSLRKTPLKRVAALAVMIIITVSSVMTVMASVKPVSVTYNGEAYTGSATSSCGSEEEARAQLLAMGLAVDAKDKVSYAEDPAGGGISITLISAHEVTVLADGTAKTVTVYHGDTVADALAAAGVTVDSNDKLSASQTAAVSSDMMVEVTRRHDVTLTADGSTQTLQVEDGTVHELLLENDIILGENDTVSHGLTTPLSEGMAVSVQRVTYEEVTAEEAIPFTETVTNDSSLPKGVTKVDVQGQDGLQRVTRRNKLVDGQVVESTVLESQVLKEAVAQVSRVGTKDPNGYATINSDGTVYDANGVQVNYSKLLTGRCSAYTGGGTTATGAPAAFGRVAVNPNVIPYGTKLFICSPDGKVVYGYAVAADTGGACMRNTIIADLYYDTLSECYQIGVRDMNVYILS